MIQIVLAKAILMRIIFFFLATLITIGSFAQQTPSKPEFNKEHYLQLSRQQKTLGTVSLVAGSLTAAVGGYIWFLAPIAGLSESGDVEGAERTGKTLVIVGSSLIGVSIPLFIASKKNKEKAMLHTGTHSIYVPLQGHSHQLTLGLRIPLQ
jgi:hypothetical protein